MTEECRCKQLAQSYCEWHGMRPGVEPSSLDLGVKCSTRCATNPPICSTVAENCHSSKLPSATSNITAAPIISDYVYRQTLCQLHTAEYTLSVKLRPTNDKRWTIRLSVTGNRVEPSPGQSRLLHLEMPSLRPATGRDSQTHSAVSRIRQSQRNRTSV